MRNDKDNQRKGETMETKLTLTNENGSRVVHLAREDDGYHVACYLNHGETMARCFKGNSTGSKTFKTWGGATRAARRFLDS